jgi:hypothetical protein
MDVRGVLLWAGAGAAAGAFYVLYMRWLGRTYERWTVLLDKVDEARRQREREARETCRRLNRLFREHEVPAWAEYVPPSRRIEGDTEADIIEQLTRGSA